MSLLAVNILDINDNLAVFHPISYEVDLLEHGLGYVTTVFATDADQVSVIH